MAIIGITKWRSKSSRQELLISSLSSTQHAFVILSGILLTVLCVNILKLFASSDYIWLDGFTTVFSIIATFLLIYRKIDNWIYFFVCNLIYIYLFYLKSAIGFSGLMLVYTILSVIGFIKWRKLMSIEMTHGKQLIKD
jgi:nicotinamide mononucleotide transporter